MHCPSCNKPLKEDARFCGHCGYKLTHESKTNVVAKDLFSINEIQTSSAATDQSATDEDFFENSNNPLTEDSEESGWVDDRKVFSEEDDPTVIDEEPTTKTVSTKKLDSKTRTKLRAKKRSGSSLLSNVINGIQSFVLLLIVSAAPIYLAYSLEGKSYLQFFLISPLMLLFFWPFVRKKGLSLNLVFKISNLWYCGALAYLIFLSNKAGLSPTIFNGYWNGFLIQIDFWMLFHIYFAFFCQSLIFYLWRAPVNWLLKISTVLLMAYSLIELLIQLKTETTINKLGNEANIITAFFKPFIGDFGLYLSPHFVMTHFFLPLTILLLVFMSFLVFVQKKWSQSISLFLYGLQGLVFICIYLLPYRNEDISSKIFSLGPIIDQLVIIIRESIPIII